VSERVCFVLQVRSERVAEYRARHAEVWPEMRAALARHGWRDYSLFLREDGLLVGVLETDDFARSLAGMAAEEVNARWQASMAPYFELPDDTPADTAIVPLRRIFHLA
jgi:L-rhamnose mutarotase